VVPSALRNWTYAVLWFIPYGISMPSHRTKSIALAIALLVTPQILVAQNASAADSAFRRSDWPAASAAYARIAASDTTNGQAWFRLGLSYENLGEYAKALPALARAKRLGFQPVAVRYRLARAYARLNDPNHAFELLDSAVALAPGNFTPQQLDAEHDFDSVRADPRYAKLSLALAAARYPCRTRPESQQFDFWIGQWDVTAWSGATPGQPPGFNDVHPILEHCIVFENWKGPAGGDGKSFNYFDTNLNKWRQIWMDDSGSALDYTGEFRDGAMRFTGWTLDAQGHRVEQKLTFTRIDDNTVRQTFEASSDGGKTWAVTFDGRYVRKK
jgi:tetratricopeptide (TPR) repeat protein